jgi:ABC-type arginine/histidine transport system permease subunit
MTPKDKAIELVDKFSNEILLTINGGKVAALIAVDEILNIYQIKNAAFDFYEVRNYWQEVKTEIQNL